MRGEHPPGRRFVSRVDPLIGVDGLGECLPGPYLPYSLVRPGPDTLPPHKTNGYDSSKPIIGFSQTHVSGTGGQSRYGNIRLTPLVGHPRFGTDGFERAEEEASAGYYRVVSASDGISSEITSTPRTAVYRFIFPDVGVSHVLLDAGSVVQPLFYPGTSNGEPPTSTGGFIEKISAHEVVGTGMFRGGWGHSFPYQVFFYARFDRPVHATLVARGDGAMAASAVDGPRSKMCLTFSGGGELGARIGISFASIAKARASVDREAHGTFDEIRDRAEAAWERMLGRIAVEGGSEDQEKLFYTLFTRVVCMPSDLGVDDEFPLWQSGVRHFSDFYCLWDSVRNANSLIALFDPEREAEMLNCLLDIADKTGWLPDAWIAGHSAHVQGGSSADILFCEAALKGIGGIDYHKALRQMRKNNECPSPDPYRFGRYLQEYRDLGYLSTNIKNCVSRTIEYGFQDWCIGRLAGHLGREDVAADYFASSQKLWTLWNDDLQLFAPRRPNGDWVQGFDPDFMRPDCWNDPYFYEGTSRQWSWNTPHDFGGLVNRMGGTERFVARLDAFFDRGLYHPKEIMLHVPYLYLYAGRPDKTTDRLQEILDRFFKVDRAGLFDNEDMGCQSAFFMWSRLGIYPLIGQDIYWLTAPSFTRSEIALGTTGASLVIEAPSAGKEKYVSAVTLNGQPLNRAWVRHGEIAKGGVLRFELGAKAGEWATRELPPGPPS